MQESTIEIRVPQSLLEYGLRTEEIQLRVAEWLAISLFIEGRVTSGKAASLLGLNRVQFLQMLRQRGVNYVDFTTEEVAEELAAAEALANIDME